MLSNKRPAAHPQLDTVLGVLVDDGLHFEAVLKGTGHMVRPLAGLHLTAAKKHT